MTTITSAENNRRVMYNCIAAAVGGLLFGFDTAVISGTIELIRGQYQLDAAMEGWFVSSGLVGCIIGVIVTGLVSNTFGRKTLLIVSGLLFLLSSIGCGWAMGIEQLVVFRLVGGIGVGVASVICPLYITELAPSAIRGRMVALYQLAITLGILLAYFSNSYLSGNEAHFGISNREVWRPMFLVMSIPSLLFIIMMVFAAESHRWLAIKTSRSVGPALQPSVRTTMTQNINADLQESSPSNRSIFHKSLRVPLLIGVLLCIFQQFCGINAIIYYGPKIFSQAGLSENGALNTQVIIGLVNVVFTFVAITQSDRMGRKKLLLFGLLGMIVSLVVVGGCFYTNYTSGFLLTLMLVGFIACFALSAGPITWILINEIFPDDVRSKAVSFCTLILWVAVWIVGQFFPWLLQQIGPAGVFWVFAGFSSLSLLFCLRVLKETKGKSLEEIEVIYSGH